MHSDVSAVSLVIAAAALVAVIVTIWLRRPRHNGPDQLSHDRSPSKHAAHEATPRNVATLLIALGAAMVDSGFPVSQVQQTLRRVAYANSTPEAEIVILPTALFVTVPGSARTDTAVAVTGSGELRLEQIDAIARVTADAEAGADVGQVVTELQRIRDSHPQFGPVVRTLGYSLLSAGLALVLRAGGIDLAVAAVLGGVVGALQLVTTKNLAYRAVLPLLCAFLVSTTVFALGDSGLAIGVLAPLVAPLVTFLPGALLTTSAIELSTGQLLSGAGRLAGGSMQLTLLALGVVAGSELVGVPAADVGELSNAPLGNVAPWIGVAVFGIGVVIHHCARPSSLGWILLVLYAAYAGQVLGERLFGPTLSAFIGALVMTPIATVIATQPTGPPTQVSFLPAFWLLVPGALGLVGVTHLIRADTTSAITSLVTTTATMVAVAFGVLIGLAFGQSLTRTPE